MSTLSVPELQEEIAFQRILLSSIDDSVHNQEAAINEVKLEISSLEQQLRTQKENEKKKNLTPYRLPTRKRSYNESSAFGDDPAHEDNKPRRTSPSPGQMRSSAATPTTSDDEYELILSRMNMKQKDAAVKIEQERLDAELARQLQQEDAEPGPSNASSSRQPAAFQQTTDISASSSQNAFDKLLGRSLYGTSSRAMSDDTKIDTLKQEQGLPIKSEPTKGQASEWKMAHSFPGVYDSDSDIEVIDADQFSFNVKSTPIASNKASRPAYSTAAEAAKQAAFNRGHLGLQKRLDDAFGDASSPYSAYKDLPPSFGTPGSTKIEEMDRPGFIYNGFPPSFNIKQGINVYGALPSSFGPVNYSGLPMPQHANPFGAPSKPPLSSIIAQTSGYNYANGMDINGIPLDRRVMDIYDTPADPRQTEQELQELLKNISNDRDIPKDEREGTPIGLKYPLYEHQKLALTWLKQMEGGSNKGGILADDMGLGKTISALALILSRPSEDRACKTTLIVGPVALIRQWEREVRQKTKPSHRLSTFVYHGAHKATWETLRTYDIVLTTYGTLGSEFKRYGKWKVTNPNQNEALSDEKARFPFLSSQSKWYRVILDEAQCIKNKNTMSAGAAYHLKSLTRFCLTGTPMMNGVHELYSLINFLRIKPYNDLRRFTTDFRCLNSSGPNQSERSRANAMRKFQAVLKAIMLRRTKSSTIDGKPILTLPEKIEVIDHVLFNEDEQTYYTSLETQSKIQFNKYQKAGTVGKNYSNILVLLLRLRQAACHPHLIMDFEEAPADITVDDMMELAKTLQPDVIRRIIEAGGQFECPVCYDPTPNPRLVIPCGHDTCSECLVKIGQQQQDNAIQHGDDAGGGSARCPSCRGKVVTSKIIDYETFKKVHMPETVDAEYDSSAGKDDSDSYDSDSLSSTDSDAESLASDNGEDLAGFVVPDDAESLTHASDDDDYNDNLDDVLDIKKSEAYVQKGTEIEEDENSSIAQHSKLLKSRTIFKRSSKAAGKAVAVPNSDTESDLGDTPQRSKRKPRSKRKARSKPKSKGKGKAKASANDDDDGDLPDIADFIGFDDNERNIGDYFVNKEKRKRSNKKSKKKSKKIKPAHHTLAMLKKEATKSAKNRKAYMNYLKENWVSSAKTDKCMELLRNTEPGIKTIVFSQFTTLLDLLEVPVRSELGRCYRRYDGSMSSDARNDAVVDFTEKPEVKIMLVSLKAGNSGLNLVAASQVIILDPFWNPYIEMQAVDRAHRIGQLKPVKVHRILVKLTVEDRIMTLQERKRKLVDAALDEKASQGLGRLGQKELAYLFNANGAERETANREPTSAGPVNPFDLTTAISLPNLVGLAGRATRSFLSHSSDDSDSSHDW